MTDDDFLRAIIDHHDDDLPRLAYADWLDDHGSGDRAEFIRVQCELAKADEADPRYRQLEDREHELLSSNERKWFDSSGCSEWEWKRGFVESVTLGRETPAERIPELFERQPIVEWHHFFYSIAALHNEPELAQRIQRLTLFMSILGRIDPDAFGESTVYSKVEHLVLHGNDRPAPMIERLLNWTPAARLKSLVFDGYTEIGPQLGRFSFATAPPRLERLSGYGIDEAGLTAFLQQPGCVALKHLDISEQPLLLVSEAPFWSAHPDLRLESINLSGNGIDDSLLRAILDCPSFEGLTSLAYDDAMDDYINFESVAQTRYWQQAIEFSARSSLHYGLQREQIFRYPVSEHLHRLDLSYNNFGTKGIADLAEAGWLRPVSWLALTGNGLDDDTCKCLAREGSFTRLRTIHLSDPTRDRKNQRLTYRGLRILARSQVINKLRVLSLSRSGLNDACALEIIESPSWQLSGLDLSDNDLTGVFVRALAKSPRLRRLNLLKLTNNPSLGGRVLLPLAESPHLSPLCELDLAGIRLDPIVQQAIRERLGPRFSC